MDAIFQSQCQLSGVRSGDGYCPYAFILLAVEGANMANVACIVSPCLDGDRFGGRYPVTR